MTGRIIGISGPTVSVDTPGLRLYERVTLGEQRLMGEVVRLARDRAVVQVYESTRGLRIREPATGTGSELTVLLGPGLLGQMFDGLQRPLEQVRQRHGPFITIGASADLSARAALRFTPSKKPGDVVVPGESIGHVEEGPFAHQIFAPVGGTIDAIANDQVDSTAPVASLTSGHQVRLFHEWPVRVPRPFRRKLAQADPLVTGQRSIDFLFPLARGGTAIFPGGFGTGKTILEQAIAKFAAVDVVIYVGCGERGNEMAEMLEEFSTLDDPWSKRPLMERTIVVVNTSNMPVAAREASIYTAVTMAEYYRDMGYHVLLLADSLSRWAEALREISSALEELPGDEGYPTQLGSRTADYFSRAGVVETLAGTIGSVTLLLSVSPPGGDFTEPVTQACLRATGAFFMLDTNLAHRRHFPAINWFQSFSLYASTATAYFDRQVSPAWSDLRQQAQTLLQQEEKLREVAEIVGTEGLQDGDRLLMQAAEELRETFLAQNAFTDDAFSSPEATFERVAAILRRYDEARQRLEKGGQTS
jgi:V/A-type H+-transporting ATPase subunit A